MSTVSAPAHAKFPSLDILRGLAILLVMLHHLPVGLQAPFGVVAVMGGRGVDLFFGLSGFLIGYTTLQRAHKYAFARAQQVLSFLILRMGRILPMYAVMLTFYAIAPFTAWDGVADVLRNHPLPYVAFFANYFFQASLELGVLWSLAIEEQFYLFVACSLILVGTGSKRLQRFGMVTALVSIVVANAYRLYLTHQFGTGHMEQGLYIVRYFFATPARVDQLAIGLFVGLNYPRLSGVVASWWQKQPQGVLLPARLGILAAVVGALLFVPFSIPVWPFLLAATFALAILGLSSLDMVRPSRPNVLSRGIAFVGRVSFSLYLLHPVFRTILEKKLPPSLAEQPFLFLILWATVAILGSAATYSLIEKPCIKASKRLEGRMAAWLRPTAPSLPVAQEAPIA